MPVATSTCRIEGAAWNALSAISPRGVGRDTNCFGVAFFAVCLELPDGVPFYHAGTNYYLQLQPLQEHRAECL